MTSHTLCMTSHSVCMPSHELFMISHPYRYDITSSIFMMSYPIYMISPLLLSWKHNECTWNLTHYIWHHSHCICVAHPLYQCHPNNYGSHHTWHTYDIILYITFTLYDINIQYLWHHKHCIHDIRSPIYDITSMVYNISSPLPVTSQPLYL